MDVSFFRPHLPSFLALDTQDFKLQSGTKSTNSNFLSDVIDVNNYASVWSAEIKWSEQSQEDYLF